MKQFLLPHLLMKSADRYPKQIALGFEDKQINFQELEEKSTKLANLLLEIGIPRGSAVGIYLSKSIEAIIAFFAVLKAGGFYIPLDHTYSPLNRIIEIIRLSETDYIITNIVSWKKIVDHNPGFWSQLAQTPKVVFIDTIFNSETINHIRNIYPTNYGNNFFLYDETLDSRLKKMPSTTDRDLAYVLYTSGSTGTPKGVMITHLNALTFIDWATDYFLPENSDVFANHAPLHFDLSVFDLYVSINCGSRVDMVPFQTASNPRALVEWIEDKRISFWYSVPQVWITILNYAEISEEKLHNLRRILFAGDIFPSKYLKILMQRLPSASYYNLYGPTETNVCTCYKVSSLTDITDHPVPIGEACDNTEVIVLDENDQLIDVGNKGELFVKGSTVTEGYYKDPLKTAQVFKRSPLLHHNGAMLYSTGDIVFRIDEHNYSYIGRKDLMVKCAGFRIELSEVENALYSHPDIAETVVISHYDEERGQRRLIAFLSTKQDTSLKVTDIKRYLAGILPKYMIPDIISSVPHIPKNANGKIDRAQVATWISIC